MDDIILYAAHCPERQEHSYAYRLLALALKQEYDLSPLPDIQRKSGGKPFFPEHPDLHFNLSHSRGVVACALHSAPVGVDVEKLRAAPKRLAGGRDDRTFFTQWTGQEATVKAAGQGLAAMLTSPETSPLCLWEEELIPGYILCVCPTEPAGIRTVLATELPQNIQLPSGYSHLSKKI